MVKKSQATAAWECRNCDQVTSDRSGAGSMPLVLRICHTVEGRDVVAEADEFAVDATVAPGWVLGREAEGESTYLRGGGGRLAAARAGSSAGQHVRRCQRSRVSGVTSHPWAPGSGECGCDHAEQAAVPLVELGAVDLAA